MKPRNYDTYLPLIRITAPSFRYKDGNREDPIPVITAIDDRAFPQQWDTTPALFSAVAGENIVGEIPDGLDRRKFWQFAAYLKNRDGLLPLLVGVDAMPSREYKKSLLPSASMDLTTMVVEWRPSGLAEVVQRPPLVKLETQALILRTINDLYLNGKKKLEAGTRISTGKTDLGVVVSISDTTIEIRPKSKASGGKPVYGAADEE